MDLILEELEILEVQSQQDIVQRMEMLGEAGASARRMVIGMAIAAIGVDPFHLFFYYPGHHPSLESAGE